MDSLLPVQQLLGRKRVRRLAGPLLVCLALVTVAMPASATSPQVQIEALGCSWADVHLNRTVEVDHSCGDDWWERASAHVVCGAVDPLENELVNGEGVIYCTAYDP